MRDYKAKGIVLHSVKYGDNALVLYLLTDTMGRQTYMVRGVRSSKGKGNRAALFQPMFVVEFVGITSPKMEMHRMRDVRNAIPLSTVPFDVRKSTISLFMAEVIYRLVREVESNPPLFEFITYSIKSLDRMEEGVANFHLWFLVKLSRFLGFYPGNEYREGNWFDVEQGLFTPQMPIHKYSLNSQNSRTLSLLMDVELSSLDDIKLSRKQRSSFLTELINYFAYHLDTINQVKSIEILKEVF